MLAFLTALFATVQSPERQLHGPIFLGASCVP